MPRLVDEEDVIRTRKSIHLQTQYFVRLCYCYAGKQMTMFENHKDKYMYVHICMQSIYVYKEYIHISYIHTNTLNIGFGISGIPKFI